jgi:hypothetical protein
LLQTINYTPALHRLLTCSLWRWHLALYKLNQWHTHSSRSIQLQLPQRLGPPFEVSHARQPLKMLKMLIAPRMYQHKIMLHPQILQLPLKQWWATWSR